MILSIETCIVSVKIDIYLYNDPNEPTYPFNSNMDIILFEQKARKPKKVKKQPTFAQIDTLEKGDIFVSRLV